MADNRLVPFEVHSTTGKLTDGDQISIDVSGFTGHLAGSSVEDVQDLAAFIDTLMTDGGSGTATAANVSVSSATLTGIIQGAANVQEALNRIDALGLGASIFEFTGNYSAQSSNINEWFNNRASIHVQGADGQSNARRTFTLAGTQALNTVFDALVAIGLPETFTILISYLGGTNTSTLSNALEVLPRAGAPQIEGQTRVILGRGDSVTLQITRSGATISNYEIISRGLLTTASGQTLNDIELQSALWNAADSTFLPSDVLKGYAFRVFNAPSDGSGRLGVRMQNNDWVVWFADSFTTWADTQNWFVIPNGDIRRLTEVGQNFLSTIKETDTTVDRGFADALLTGDFLVWLSPAVLATAPFLNPSTDTDNPRTPETLPYIGGRENRNAQNQFQFGANRANFFLYVGINPTAIANEKAENFDILLRDLDGTIVRRLNLATQFRDLTGESDFTNGDVRHYVFNAGGLGDEATFNYASLETIEIVLKGVDRRFSIDVDDVDLTPNVNNIPESKLSLPVQAKLNVQHGITPEQESKLLGLESNQITQALPDNTPFKLTYSQPTLDSTAYSDHELQDGIIPDFVNRTITVLVPKIVSTLTITRTTGLAENGEYLGLKAFTGTLLAATTDNPLNEISLLSGTGTFDELSGAAPSFKIDRDNIPSDILDKIDNPPSTLPEPLRALNNQAEVFNVDNVEFVSKNNHVGIANTWAVLKFEPDGTDGTPTYPITANDFINEITQSDVTLTPPTDLASVYIPTMIGGQLDNGVDVFTNGRMTGAGIVQAGFEINLPSQNNFHQVIGFWLYFGDVSASNKRLIEVKDTGDVYRPVISLRNGNLSFNRNNQDGSPATTRQVTHTLYALDGTLSHTFAGTAAQEEQWRVYEARTYTINARLIANGNDEGSTTVNYAIADLNTSQGAQTQTLSFANGHTQDIIISYVANSSLYGGAGHTLRVQILELADNVNFDIDHIIMSVTYVTTENVPATDDTYSVVETGVALQPNALNKCIFAFTKNATTDNLECIFSVNGNAFRIDSFNYDVFRYQWDGFMLNDNDLTVMQNIQGYVLNTDTPANELPSQTQLNDYITHHGTKTSYVWDNVLAPLGNVEAAHFPEFVNFENLILVSANGTKFRLDINNDGSLQPTIIT